MNIKPVETLREKEEEMLLGSSSCRDSLEIPRLHPSPSSTCQSPCHPISGPRTPYRNVSNTPALVENPLSSSTPGRATTPVLSHSPPSLLQLSPWDDNCSISLPSSTPQPTRSTLSPTFANSTSSLLSPTFANSSASAGNLLLSPNNFTAILPAPANTPTCRETALRLREGGAEQGVLMEAATRLQYRMRGEEIEQSVGKLRQHMVEESGAFILEQQVNQLRSAFPGMDDMSTSEVLATTVDFLHFARARSGKDLISKFLNERPCY